MTVKSLQELPKVPLRVMRARRGLRMVLHRDDGVLAVPHAFHGAVIEVEMGDLKLLRTRNRGCVAPNREPVVL